MEAAVSELTGNEYKVLDDEDDVAPERDEVIAEEDLSPESPRKDAPEIRQY